MQTQEKTKRQDLNSKRRSFFYGITSIIGVLISLLVFKLTLNAFLYGFILTIIDLIIVDVIVGKFSIQKRSIAAFIIAVIYLALGTYILKLDEQAMVIGTVLYSAIYVAANGIFPQRLAAPSNKQAQP